MTHTHIEKWNAGRMWIWDLFRIEWEAPTTHLMFHIDFFSGDSNRDLSLTIATKLFYFHFALQGILPRAWMPKTDYKTSFGEERTFGVSYHNGALWLSLWEDEGGSSREQPWYLKSLTIDMPWRREWVRTSILLSDGSWEHEFRGQRKEFYKKEWKEKRFQEVYPYKYTLRSGKVQNVIATISVEERERRPKWLQWTKLFASTSRTISIDFSDEVGDMSGSWKGGVLSCGYNLNPDETPRECLERMERERRFR